MRSTFGGFNTVVRGIFANQAGLDTTGHNVTNAGTDGYSRQTVNLSTTDPQTIGSENGSYQIGTGVTVQSVIRARDSLIDKQYWKESSALSYNTNTQELMAKIESAFGEPSDTGIQTVLNSFWTSWQTLGRNASEDSVRTTVRENGVAVVNAIQTSAKQLKNMVADINDVIEKRVKTINQYADEIAALNKKIFSVEAAGTDHANDLRDRRDYLCDQLSSIIDTRVSEDSKGNYIVQTGSGYVLADSSTSTHLEVIQSRDEDYGYMLSNVKIAGSPSKQVVDFKSGEMKSLLDVRDSTNGGIKGYLNDLSNMSKFLLQDFNQVHRSGFGSDNSTNNNFFGADAIDYNSNVQIGYSRDNWITELSVNQGLFAPGGTARIAAKTAGASIGVSQFNQTGSNATVFATGTYANGTVPTDVQVKVNSIDVANNIVDVVYSTDGGNTFSAPVALTGNQASLSINGLTVDMYFDPSTTNKAGDWYKFSLNDHSADSNITIKQSNLLGGTGNIVSASGSYTKGDVATSVTVQPVTIDAATNPAAVPPTTQGKVRTVRYSLDGGVSWVAGVVNLNTADNTFSLAVNGVTLKMSIATDTDTTTNDQYTFTISKGNVASGDNAALLCQRLKTDTSATLGNMSLDSYYSAAVGALGVKREDAQRAESNQKTLVEQLNNWRQSVSGVSIDEEMTNMIKYQKGYNAAARVMTTMDEMLDKLINGTGVVGR